MKTLIFLFPITLFLSFLCIKILLPDAYMSLIQEDSNIEYLQVLFYNVSSLLSFYASIKFLRSRLLLHGILYALLAIAILFVAIEEISWGQRILHIATPGFFEQHNVQHEISLHNLNMIQANLNQIYILVGAYGAFAWVFLALFLPRSKLNCRHFVNYLVPDWFVSPYFFFPCFIYFLFEYISQPYTGSFLVWRDQEPMELLLSMGFFTFMVTNFIRLRHCLTTKKEVAISNA